MQIDDNPTDFFIIVLLFVCLLSDIPWLFASIPLADYEFQAPLEFSNQIPAITSSLNQVSNEAIRKLFYRNSMI